MKRQLLDVQDSINTSGVYFNNVSVLVWTVVYRNIQISVHVSRSKTMEAINFVSNFFDVHFLVQGNGNSCDFGRLLNSEFITSFCL